MSDYLDINNEELLKDFFSEAEQQVENLESNILVIENDPTNHEAIDEIFRAAHTLKGGSATVEMTELSSFTHVVEDLLDEIRSDRVSVSEDVVDVLLSSIDVIKAMLEARQNGSIYDADVEPIKNKLKSFIPAKKDKSSGVQKKSPVAPAPVATPVPVSSGPGLIPAPGSLLSEYDLLELKQACPAGQKLWGVTVLFDEKNPMNSVGGIQVFAALKNKGMVLKTIPEFDELYEDTFHQKVVYFVATSVTADELEDTAFIPDVTDCTDAQAIELASPAPSAASASVAVAPVAVPVQKTEIISDAPSVPAAPVEVPAEQKQASADNDGAAVQNAAPVAKPAPAKDSAKKSTGNHSSSGSLLRVDSKRIDYLLNLVSETVITKASFNQIAMQVGDLLVHFQSIGSAYKEKVHSLFEQLPKFLEEIQNGSSVKDIRSASELQEGVMKIRMVPISQIFSRFPRVVRDLSKDLNKKVNLVIEGEETELDKSVIEDLLDPIMHCVRNSLDHGIEHPEDRKKLGKNEEGTLLLKASNEGNQIVIDIADDGSGIDVARVRQKAIDRGLIHPNKILTDQEAYQLIFEPGFSTSDKITNVSGRGVGLDVVKTQIEKLNGSVIVSSEHGIRTWCRF